MPILSQRLLKEEEKFEVRTICTVRSTVNVDLGIDHEYDGVV